jgi:hypothetical protein
VLTVDVPSKPLSSIRASCFAVLLLFISGISFAAQGRSADKFAHATGIGDSAAVFPEIATHEIREGNTVTPPGYPIGEPRFRIVVGQVVDVIDLIPNDTESRYTCKVRTEAGETGFIVCNDLELKQWQGERGELVQILLGKPYEYEGSVSRRLEDIRRFGEFIAKYPSGRLTKFAELEIISLRCGLILSLVQDVWYDISDLKAAPSEHVRQMWTSETNKLYLSLEKGELGRVKEIAGICSLVSKLQRSVAAPVTFVGDR